MPDPDLRLQEFVGKIRQRGGRLTPQRVAVLKVLAESKGHPSVEQIYARIKADFPTTSLATVYKTVSLLKEMDEVLELGFADDSNRYDGNRPYPHPHLICTRCGDIQDLQVPHLKEIVQQVSQEVGSKWAGELQDGTMQGLAAMRMLLSSAINDHSREALERAAGEAVQQLEDEIGELRALIAEMRGEQRRHGEPFGGRQTSISPRSSA